MKSIIKYLIFNKFIARLTLLPLLKLHSFSYNLSGIYASIINNGIHPKHRIMKYKEWFLDNLHKDWVVLDIGCNTGMMPEVFSKKVSFVYGIEIDCNMIERALKERSYDNIEYICADATTYNYDNLQSVDCITLSNVLEHIENRIEFLNEIVNNIKWNATKRILIRVPMIDREWIAVYKKELDLEYRLDNTHFVEYTFAQFKQELQQANISIMEFEIKFGEIYAVCVAD